MPDKMPRRTHRRALTVVYTVGPMAVTTTALWVAGPSWLPLPERHPDVLYGVGIILTMTTLSAVIVAALSGAQLAIAKAFMAGYNTGLAVAQQGRDGNNGDGAPRPLRLVE